MSELIRQEKPQLLQVWGADFDKAQRFAQALIASPIFPKKYKDVGSAIIILDIAQRLEIGPLEVAQNIHIVHDAPVWKSEYVIAQIEASEKYIHTEYVETEDGMVDTGKGKIKNMTCTFVATLPNGKQLQGTTVSYAMAVAEGWWNRSGSKWPNMPQQMLRYRAAAFFNRAYPTARLLGIRQKDEVEDIGYEDATEAVVVESTPATPRKPKAAPPTQAAAPTHVVTITEAVTIDDGLEAAKEEQRKLAAGDVEWTAAIDAAASLEDLERVQQEFDL